MATKTSRITTLDRGRRPDIEEDLTNKYGVKWSYVANVSTAAFDLEKSLHNQARFEAIDEKVVATYTEGVLRGDAFPGVLAWKPSGNLYTMIDGNHRLVSHVRAEAFLPGVYEIDPGTDPRTVAIMTFSFNTRHGMATSEAERITGALYLIDNGANVEAAAGVVNMPVRQIKVALARSRADARADEVGMRRNEWDSFLTTVKTRLSNIHTDEGFADAARLTYRAKLSLAEVSELVAQMNATKSGMRQRAIVEQVTSFYQDRIDNNAGGVLGSNRGKKLSPRHRVSMALSQVLSLPDDDNAISAAYIGEERLTAAKRMSEASDRFRRLADILGESRG